MDKDKIVSIAKEAGFQVVDVWMTENEKLTELTQPGLWATAPVIKFAELLLAEQPTQVDKLVEALREIVGISCFNDGAFESAKYTAEQALAAYEAKR